MRGYQIHVDDASGTHVAIATIGTAVMKSDTDQNGLHSTECDAPYTVSLPPSVTYTFVIGSDLAPVIAQSLQSESQTEGGAPSFLVTFTCIVDGTGGCTNDGYAMAHPQS